VDYLKVMMFGPPDLCIIKIFMLETHWQKLRGINSQFPTSYHDSKYVNDGRQVQAGEGQGWVQYGSRSQNFSFDRHEVKLEQRNLSASNPDPCL
jgi:hypothetical protein